jgi:phenylpropionate dioxygenase-like ring-hydroxylating dioxygenase large terminal subunit
MYPLREGMFAPKNAWYVAAWSSEVTRQPFERWILNEPVAFYRTEAGNPVALAGRCPHRHFPLGKSRIVGDNVECGYHGITFAPDGSCARIPSQLEIPSACKIRSYPTVERWKWIWIWTGDPALADESLIPDHRQISLLDSGFETTGDVYYEVPGRYMLMHDNLLDLSHLSYLHQTTIASGGVPEAKELREQGDRWSRSTRKLQGTDCPPYFAGPFDYEGAVDRSLEMTTYFPALHVGFDEFRRAESTVERPGEHLGTVSVYHAITPGRLNDAHYFFALGRNFSLNNPALSAALIEGIRPTLEEDMLATREIELMLQSLGETPKEVLLRSDAHCVQGRRVFEDLIGRETAPVKVIPVATGR